MPKPKSKLVSCIDPTAEGNEPWRDTLLHALIHGDLEGMERDLSEHIEGISSSLTCNMSRAKLEWATIYWWKVQDATPLFIACLFSYPELVRWLLLRGADRTVKCYLGQTAMDLCGEYAKHASSIEDCRKLLRETPLAPSPPVNPRYECHISTESVVRRIQVPEENDRGVMKLVEKKIIQELHKCIVKLYWLTPLCNGAMIEKYEVRYRVHVPGEKSTMRGWRSQLSSHTRLHNEQSITMEGLQLGTAFDISIRSQNSIGRGEWGSISLLVTPKLTAKDGSNHAATPES